MPVPAPKPKAPVPEILIADERGAPLLSLCQVMVGADLMVRVDLLDATLRMGPRHALAVAEHLRRMAIPLLMAEGSEAVH